MTATVEQVHTRFSDGRRIVLNENERLLNSVAAEQWDRAGSLITNARVVFVIGNGRSGLATQMAAMRLMHLGLRVHVAGEVTAPAIGAGDVLIAVSGSGTTSSVVGAADTAKKVGASVLAVTTAAESPLAQRADEVLVRTTADLSLASTQAACSSSPCSSPSMRCSWRCGATRTRPPSGCGNATPTSADPAPLRPRMAHR
jgi:6-phospho-3-hexuloisomerase